MIDDRTAVVIAVALAAIVAGLVLIALIHQHDRKPRDRADDLTDPGGHVQPIPAPAELATKPLPLHEATSSYCWRCGTDCNCPRGDAA